MDLIKTYILELDEGAERFFIYHNKNDQINDIIRERGFYLKHERETLNKKPYSTLERAQENLKTEIKLFLMRKRSEAIEDFNEAEIKLKTVEGLEKIINKKSLEDFELKQVE